MNKQSQKTSRLGNIAPMNFGVNETELHLKNQSRF